MWIDHIKFSTHFLIESYYLRVGRNLTLYVDLVSRSYSEYISLNNCVYICVHIGMWITSKFLYTVGA